MLTSWLWLSNVLEMPYHRGMHNSQKSSSQPNEPTNIWVKCIEVCADSLRHPTFISLPMFMAKPVICLGNYTPIDLMEINIPTPALHLMICGWPHWLKLWKYLKVVNKSPGCERRLSGAGATRANVSKLLSRRAYSYKGAPSVSTLSCLHHHVNEVKMTQVPSYPCASAGRMACWWYLSCILMAAALPGLVFLPALPHPPQC